MEKSMTFGQLQTDFVAPVVIALRWWWTTHA
jgi:hypothetical protein